MQTKPDRPLMARVNDEKSGNWWCVYHFRPFQVIAFRQYTVLVRANKEDNLQYPYNTHEFPNDVLEFMDKETGYAVYPFGQPNWLSPKFLL